jgi:hypothetical protein
MQVFRTRRSTSKSPLSRTCTRREHSCFILRPSGSGLAPLFRLAFSRQWLLPRANRRICRGISSLYFSTAQFHRILILLGDSGLPQSNWSVSCYFHHAPVIDRPESGKTTVEPPRLPRIPVIQLSKLKGPTAKCRPEFGAFIFERFPLERILLVPPVEFQPILILPPSTGDSTTPIDQVHLRLWTVF